MIQFTDIHSLTDFLRNHKGHIERLRKKGRPEILTVHGKAAVVVQDPVSYQKFLDLVEQAETIARIQRGLDDVTAGRTKPGRRVLAEMRQKLRIPRAR
jgi:hypothetical protein